MTVQALPYKRDSSTQGNHTTKSKARLFFPPSLLISKTPLYVPLTLFSPRTDVHKTCTVQRLKRYSTSQEAGQAILGRQTTPESPSRRQLHLHRTQVRSRGTAGAGGAGSAVPPTGDGQRGLRRRPRAGLHNLPKSMLAAPGPCPSPPTILGQGRRSARPAGLRGTERGRKRPRPGPAYFFRSKTEILFPTGLMRELPSRVKLRFPRRYTVPSRPENCGGRREGAVKGARRGRRRTRPARAAAAGDSPGTRTSWRWRRRRLAHVGSAWSRYRRASPRNSGSERAGARRLHACAEEGRRGSFPPGAWPIGDGGVAWTRMGA